MCWNSKREMKELQIRSANVLPVVAGDVLAPADGTRVFIHFVSQVRSVAEVTVDYVVIGQRINGQLVKLGVLNEHQPQVTFDLEQYGNVVIGEWVLVEYISSDIILPIGITQGLARTKAI